jgi:hypothetical protein
VVDEEAQDWLREHVPIIGEQIKDFPKLLETEKEVCGIMCHVDVKKLQNIIDFITDKLLRVGKTSKNRECEEHEKCSIFCPSPFRLNFMKALGARFLAAQPRASPLGKIFTELENTRFLMPRMQPYSDFAGEVASVTEEDFLEFATGVTVEKNKQSERLQKARGAKKRKSQETTEEPFMEFVKKMTEEDLCDTRLEGFSIDKFLTHFLSLSYKIRTKKEIAAANAVMQECREKFYKAREQNSLQGSAELAGA